jgi:hypothetical protein
MALPPMPMPGALPGGAPRPIGSAGPAGMPTPMAGSQQQGMASVKTGLEALQKALPNLPMGSALHQAILKAVADIGKHLEKEGGGGGDQMAAIQQLIEMARTAKTQPGMAAMMPPGAPPAGGPAGAPSPMGAGAPPVTPPMGA